MQKICMTLSENNDKIDVYKKKFDKVAVGLRNPSVEFRYPRLSSGEFWNPQIGVAWRSLGEDSRRGQNHSTRLETPWRGRRILSYGNMVWYYINLHLDIDVIVSHPNASYLDVSYLVVSSLVVHYTILSYLRLFYIHWT